MSSSPRFFPNNLCPVALDDASLRTTLAELQIAIASVVNQILHQHVPGGQPLAGSKKESIYTGYPGIALMLMRLAAQFDTAGLGEMHVLHNVLSASDIQARIPAFLSQLLPSPLHTSQQRIFPSRLSPLDSPIGPALLSVLAALAFPPVAATDVGGARPEWNAAVKMLHDAARVAADDRSSSAQSEDGANEVLYGRAGFLWSLLNLRAWLFKVEKKIERIEEGKEAHRAGAISEQQRHDIEHILGCEESVIHEIWTQLLKDGHAQAHYYEQVTGRRGLPLMWLWHGRYYLGAIHGIAGILTVVLQAPPALVKPYLQLVEDCTGALCALAMAPHNDGHLPSSLPEKRRPHGQELVQICHGSPGLILLLATFRERYPDRWRHEWEAAADKASEVVWREGLLKKGLGVCHGVAGNAWPWLLYAHAAKGTDAGDLCLSRALAFLLHARSLPPLGSGAAAPSTSAGWYRTPDHAYSLFEGAAGTVCAWLDACVVIRTRMSADVGEGPLGVVGIGGAGVCGLV